MMTRLLSAAAALSLTAAAVAFAPVSADAIGTGVYKPLEGFAQSFGTKHLIGYFKADEGTCAMTLVIADQVDPDLAPGTGTQVRFALPAGNNATLDSGDGGAVSISCAGSADRVSVLTSGGA
ncbi:hypothetical protein [Oharaeibacter diazotrophicus]|uniref:Uncharacterized protein n=1 Tax=Oharaeibacter diazotrophicus TaxID=1920512 RepID=A0A4R6RB79_9HYPH|nr:hypothetical protein [Oharaeibacter diazotrophicus]TDP83381.1 hypothetical protein EDD54_3343 [Oharaeibacter diazotrophicus]BBE72214.1 hypothetical protein OHA_1_01803 [Pleomorphomonas sp. SM30]GLS78981.1 hypothetical protein GCM10007904_43180 [Oharaeibacter diazotrophicus]